MALATFATQSVTALAASTASASVLIPTTGTPTQVIVDNPVDRMVWVSLSVGAGTVTPAAGVPVPMFGQVVLTIGTNTYINAITAVGTTTLNVIAAT